MPDEADYGPAIHVVLTAAMAQLADASTTLLSHRLRASILLVGAVLFASLSHRLTADVAAVLWAACALVASWPFSVNSGVNAISFYEEYGSGTPEAAAAQLVVQCQAAFEDHARRVALASRWCSFSAVFALVALLTLFV